MSTLDLCVNSSFHFWTSCDIFGFSYFIWHLGHPLKLRPITTAYSQQGLQGEAEEGLWDGRKSDIQWGKGEDLGSVTESEMCHSQLHIITCDLAPSVHFKTLLIQSLLYNAISLLTGKKSSGPQRCQNASIICPCYNRIKANQNPSHLLILTFRCGLQSSKFTKKFFLVFW